MIKYENEYKLIKMLDFLSEHQNISNNTGIIKKSKNEYQLNDIIFINLDFDVSYIELNTKTKKVKYSEYKEHPHSGSLFDGKNCEIEYGEFIDLVYKKIKKKVEGIISNQIYKKQEEVKDRIHKDEVYARFGRLVM